MPGRCPFLAVFQHLGIIAPVLWFLIYGVAPKKLPSLPSSDSTKVLRENKIFIHFDDIGQILNVCNRDESYKAH